MTTLTVLTALNIEQTFPKNISKTVTNIFILYGETETKMDFQNQESSIIESSSSADSSVENFTKDNAVYAQDVDKPAAGTSSCSIISDFAHLRPRGGLRGKSYWRDVIDEVEFAVHCVSEPRLPVIDYSLVLPPHLRERVKQIQAYDYSTSDDVVFIRDEMREERPHDYQIASEDSREEEGAPLVSSK